MARSRAPSLWVVAGTNGAGKSSVLGGALRASGLAFFDPDAAARRIREVDPAIAQVDANALAWREGLARLDEAIAARTDYAFETTLGGDTIARRLLDAAAEGFDVNLWYVGLASPELHLARIAERVAAGGHDIPEGDVRRRFVTSRENVVGLMPALARLWVYDNSASVAFGRAAPALRLVMSMRRGRLAAPVDVGATPEWAQPLVMAAVRLGRRPLRPVDEARAPRGERKR